MLHPKTSGRALFLVAAALTVAGSGGDPPPAVEIIEVSGVLDDATLGYLTSSIEEAAGHGRALVIVQLDSPGVVGSFEQLERASELVADPPLPLVVWLGPTPARAGGGAAQLMALAPIRAAAPGAIVENWSPAVVGSPTDLVEAPAVLSDSLVVEGPVAGLIDLASPSLRQLLQDLDGTEVTVEGETRTLQTLTETNGGVTTVPVSFRQPGLLHRFLHLAAQPEAAFFFLVAGLTVAAFEFYALGPGVAAAAASLSLLLGGYGMVILPVRGWAVLVTIAGVGLLTAGYQRGGVIGLTILGTAMMVVGGLNFTHGSPQIVSGPLGVVASVLAVLFFYLLAMPTVGRARFSTPTLGRDYLIGRQGFARVDLAPDGVVEIDGGRWPATTHREAGILDGDLVRVVGVSGWQLEVEREREN